MSNVTDCEVHALKERKGKIVAFAKVTLNDDIVIDGVKLIDGAKGLFVGMPSTKSKQGTFSDIAYVKTKELKDEIQNIVLEKYEGQSDENQTAVVAVEDDDLPF